MKTLPGIPEVTEEMTFPENDQQMASQVVTKETAPPDKNNNKIYLKFIENSFLNP
jgi:hypothetical protein